MPVSNNCVTVVELSTNFVLLGNGSRMLCLFGQISEKAPSYAFGKILDTSVFETSLKFLRHCQVTQKYLNQNGEKIVKVPSPLTVSKICFAENDCSLKSNLNLNLTLSKDEQQLLSGLISLQ